MDSPDASGDCRTRVHRLRHGGEYALADSRRRRPEGLRRCASRSRCTELHMQTRLGKAIGRRIDSLVPTGTIEEVSVPRHRSATLRRRGYAHAALCLDVPSARTTSHAPWLHFSNGSDIRRTPVDRFLRARMGTKRRKPAASRNRAGPIPGNETVAGSHLNPFPVMVCRREVDNTVRGSR